MVGDDSFIRCLGRIGFHYNPFLSADQKERVDTRRKDVWLIHSSTFSLVAKNVICYRIAHLLLLILNI